MEKNKRIWIIGLITLALVGLIYFVARGAKRAAIYIGGSASGGGSASTDKGDAAADSLPDAGFPLRPGTPYGSYGRQVLYVQAYLNKYTGRNLTLDGKYGPLTLEAVVANFYDPESRQPLKEISKEFYDQTFKPFESKLNEYLSSK